MFERKIENFSRLFFLTQKKIKKKFILEDIKFLYLFMYYEVKCLNLSIFI